MTEIWSSSGLIYNPRLQIDFPVLSSDLKMELNKAGSLTFSLPPSHPRADQLYKMASECWVLRDGEEIYRGRVLYSDRDLTGCRDICCEGLRAVLNDDVLRPSDLSADGTYTGSAAGLIDLVCTAYNSRHPGGVSFSRGTVSDFGTITTDAANYTKIGEFLDGVIEVYGGYLSVRRINGNNQIDYTAQSGGMNGQTIRFGDNLIDMQEHITGEDVFNVVIPLGKTGDDDAGRLTIVDAQNSGGKDYIENQAAVAMLGVRIAKVVTFDDIEDADELYAAGAAIFNEGGGLVTSIKLSAIDLHAANVSISALRLGEHNMISVPPFGISMIMPMSQCSLDLLNAENDTFTFGVTMTTLSEMQARSKTAIAATMNRAYSAATPAQVSAAIANSEARQGDYVTETGTSGIWTWRKWASGIAECTGISEITVEARSMTALVSVYYKEGSEPYPSGLFASVPTVCSGAFTGDCQFWTGMDTTAQTKGSAKYAIFADAQVIRNSTFKVALTAVGRWN